MVNHLQQNSKFVDILMYFEKVMFMWYFLLMLLYVHVAFFYAHVAMFMCSLMLMLLFYVHVAFHVHLAVVLCSCIAVLCSC